MATFKYSILNRRGDVVEDNIPEREQAETYVKFLQDNNPSETYSVEETRVYTVKGLGRDPDLH